MKTSGIISLIVSSIIILLNFSTALAQGDVSTGAGTVVGDVNLLTKWSIINSGTPIYEIAKSQIFDNGVMVGIGTVNVVPNTRLSISGNTLIQGDLNVLSLPDPSAYGSSTYLKINHSYYRSHIAPRWRSFISTYNSDLYIQSPLDNWITANTIINANGNSDGRVGIGTSSPTAKLHVNGALLVEGATETVSLIGAGTRLAWIPALKAFRAGTVSSTEASATIGVNSIAMGLNLIASGSQSLALVTGSKATNSNAVAIGNLCNASAINSMAIGDRTVANQTNSISIGKNMQNTKPNSLAIGFSEAPSMVPALFVSDSRYAGIVGIGTNNPRSRLEIVTSEEFPALKVTRTGSQSNTLTVAISSIPMNIAPGSVSFVMSNTTPGDMAFSTNGSTSQFIIKNNGNVGLGTINPTAKFQLTHTSANTNTYSMRIDADVDKAIAIGVAKNNNGIKTDNFLVYADGYVYAREINVKLGAFPDFVFDEGYKLRSLEEVKSYIRENGHLPDIPSQQDVDASGLNVGEFNALLLQKIEELTLYIIQQDSLIKELHLEVEKLK